MNPAIMRLKAKVKNLAAAKGIPAQTTLQCYALERFLLRLSRTRYREMFVLKGGLLISSWVGLAVRTTMDMDGSIHGLSINEENVKRFIADIIAVQEDDGFALEMKGLQELQIREGDAGIRVSMLAKADPLAIPFTIDLTAGDLVVPKESLYEYATILGDATIPVLSYSIETVLAEKLHSTLSRGVLNTRMRDYYDIHVLLRLRPYDAQLLKEAVKVTFGHREFGFDRETALKTLVDIARSTEISRLWESYRLKYAYAKDISLDEALGSVRMMVEEL